MEKATIVGKEGKESLKEWVELPNGCLCCSVKYVIISQLSLVMSYENFRGDFLMAIENLIKKKDSFEYVIVECDGLVDPGALAGSFWVDDELESQVYLDGIITLVDAKHILQHLNKKKQNGVINEAERQIAFADRIIINKRFGH